MNLEAIKKGSRIRVVFASVMSSALSFRKSVLDFEWQRKSCGIISMREPEQTYSAEYHIFVSLSGQRNPLHGEA